MTRDEIVEMAKQAGWQYAHGDSGYEPLWAFAKLVAEHEREACANICETLELSEWPDKVRQPLAQAIRARGNHD